jgi:hypothetical protein
MGAVVAAGEYGDDEWEPASEIAESLYREIFKPIPKSPSSSVSTNVTVETTLTLQSPTETASFAAIDRFEDPRVVPPFACCPCKSHLHTGALTIAVGSPEKIIAVKETNREKEADLVNGSFAAAKSATMLCLPVKFTLPFEHMAKTRCRKRTTAAYEISREPKPPIEKIVSPLSKALGIAEHQETAAELANGSSTAASAAAAAAASANALCLPVKFSSPLVYNAKILCRKRSTAAYEMSLNPNPPVSLFMGDKMAHSGPRRATPAWQPQKSPLPAEVSEKTRIVSVEQPVQKRRRSRLASSDESSAQAQSKCDGSEEDNDNYEERLKRLMASRRRSTETRAMLTHAARHNDALDATITTSTSFGMDLIGDSQQYHHHRVVVVMVGGDDESKVKQGAAIGKVLFATEPETTVSA